VEGMELYSTETTIVIGKVGTKFNYFFVHNSGSGGSGSGSFYLHAKNVKKKLKKP
jgi:hypothetical protein